MTTDATYVRSPDAVATEPERGKTVLLQLVTGEYHSLNESGTTLWAELEKPRTLDALADRLVEKFDVDRTRAEQDAKNFVDELVARKLIVPA